MKAEERHRLQENDLARGLPYFIKEYGSYVLLAAALCLLAYQGYNYYQRKQEQGRYQAWAQLQAAETAGKDQVAQLEKVAQTSSSRAIQAIALDKLAALYLEYVAAGSAGPKATGLNLSKDEALNRAETALDRVVSEYGDQKLAVGIAQVDLGTLAENRGEWDKAQAAYQKVMDQEGKDSAFGQFAARKLKGLDDLKKPVQFAEAPAATGPAAGMKLDLSAPLPGLPGANDLLNPGSPDAATQPDPAAGLPLHQ